MKHTVTARSSGVVLASGSEGQTVRLFEGNLYFAPEAVQMAHLRVTERTYTCPYKGVCYWIDLENGAEHATNIGWVYNDPKPGYEFIRGQIAFYNRDTAGTHAGHEAE